MKEGWKESTVGDVCLVVAGQSPKGEYYNKEGKGTPFYQGKKDFGDKYLGKPTTWTTGITKIAYKGDILMSVRAPVGPVNISTDEICIGRGLAAIRPIKGINRDFLFYYFLFIQSELIGNDGAVFNSINKSQIEQIGLPIPPLDEQQGIVQKLDAAFAAIDQAIANTEKNLENVKNLSDIIIEKIFSERVKNNQQTTLDSCCTLVRGPFGGSLKKSYFVEDGYAVYEQSHAIYGDFSNVRYFISDQKYSEMKRFTVNSNDLIMSCSGTMGKVSIIPENHKPGIINQALLKISPNSTLLLSKYLKYWMESNDFQNKIMENSYGAAIKNVASVKVLKEIRFPLPSILEQKEIIYLVEENFIMIDILLNKYSKKLSDLQELKQSILQKAFQGEL